MKEKKWKIKKRKREKKWRREGKEKRREWRRGLKRERKKEKIENEMNRCMWKQIYIYSEIATAGKEL